VYYFKGSWDDYRPHALWNPAEEPMDPPETTDDDTSDDYDFQPNNYDLIEGEN
jgi:hypothetical protein